MFSLRRHHTTVRTVHVIEVHESHVSVTGCYLTGKLQPYGLSEPAFRWALSRVINSWSFLFHCGSWLQHTEIFVYFLQHWGSVCNWNKLFMSDRWNREGESVCVYKLCIISGPFYVGKAAVYTAFCSFFISFSSLCFSSLLVCAFKYVF